MSSAELALAFTSALRDTGARSSVLRLALARGEVLRLPRVRSVHVLSGTAWVSQDAKDHVVEPGRCLRLARNKDRPVVSAAGPDPVLFEVW
jgi:hypothetical protein